VVATGPGGPSEVVADGVTGLIVPPDDAPALATALRRLEHDPALREAMGRAGRARMVERFSVERYAERLLEICGQTRRPIR
jgi:starch synthase